MTDLSFVYVSISNIRSQGYGKYLWRMQGMFRANGGCGYVKKPDILLNTDKFFDPTETLPINRYLKVGKFLHFYTVFNFPLLSSILTSFVLINR